MQNLFLFIILAIAIYYLYRKLIKNSGCKCSSNNGCSKPTLINLGSNKNGDDSTGH